MSQKPRFSVQAWLIVTVVGIILALIGADIGLLDYPGFFVFAFSLGNAAGQYIRLIVSRRRDKKNSGTGYAQGGFIR